MTGEPLHTNCDLYRFVDELARQHAETARDLEQYLTSLWHLGSRHRSESAVSLACFAKLLDEAFTVARPATPPARLRAGEDAVGEGFQEWEHTIASQIADLCEMREVGILANELRYFGVDAPSGARWYNFDPLTYVECATAATFGGSERDDIDAPGEVPEVSWTRFTEFLRAGQLYE